MSITARGGYQIVDLSGYILQFGTAVDGPGVFEQAFNARNKPVLVSNAKILVAEDTYYTMPDTFGMMGISEDSGTYTIEITIITGTSLFIISCNNENNKVKITTSEISTSEQ